MGTKSRGLSPSSRPGKPSRRKPRRATPLALAPAFTGTTPRPHGGARGPRETNTVSSGVKAWLWTQTAQVGASALPLIAVRPCTGHVTAPSLFPHRTTGQHPPPRSPGEESVGYCGKGSVNICITGISVVGIQRCVCACVSVRMRLPHSHTYIQIKSGDSALSTTTVSAQ